MWASPADLVRYGVRRGDLLVAEGGDVGRAEFAPIAAEQPVILQNSLHRLRGDAVSLRVLKYCLGFIAASGWLDVLCNRSTFGHLTREKLCALRVPWPSAEERQAIANFLDVETTQIDAVAARRVVLVSLLRERHTIVAETLIRDAAERYGVQPLKYATRRIEVGIVVTPASWYADEGTVALRGVNVRPGELVLDDVVRINDEGHRLHSKSVLRAGDVAVVRAGQAGAAAVVPAELDGCN